ncbi:protein leg1a-like [Lissotriton helveticus]
MAPLGLGLTLLCALVSRSSAEAPDPALVNHFPLLWAQAPARLEEFRTKDHRVRIDPWNYLDRMGMGKALLNYTENYNIITVMNRSRSPLWSLPLLSEWLYQSGRLADPPNKRTCGDKSVDQYCISPYSWGACMDYYLITPPFLVAVKVGIVQFQQKETEIEILPPKECSNDFCCTYDSCLSSIPSAMDKWKLFFETIMHSTSSSKVPAAVDQLQHFMWEAHEASIEAALPICKNRLDFLPAPEADFDLNLAKGVHIIGATRFKTEYEPMKEFMANLLPRVLRAGDKCPSTPDFTPAQNTVCQMLKMLRGLITSSGGSLLLRWKEAMCSPEGRKVCEDLLQSMFAGQMYTLPELTEKLKPYAGTVCIPFKQK